MAVIDAADGAVLPFALVPSGTQTTAVSPDYFDRRPFRLTGTIDHVDVEVFAPGSGQRR